MSVAPGRILGFARVLRWILFGIALALGSLFVAWRALAAVDFAYPLLYDALSIDRTIARYGPQNHVRPDFQMTDRAERERLFAAIATAVRHNGQGLAALAYHAPDGRTLGPLLTPPEIQHLHDVARLIGRFERLGWLSWLVVLWLLAAAALRRERLPRARTFAAGAGAIVGAAAVVTFALGPENVFYWLHAHVFPPGHPWFFYYQQSLMSMMMQAPNLFGPIAALLLALAIPVFAAGLWASRRSLDRAGADTPGGADDRPHGRG